jgi:acyl-CoA synthetase (AMP-forming)/AMP-acid ligase II
MWSDEQETSVTFGQFIDQARAQAATFRSHGLAKGDTVILILPQGIDLMTAFVGAMMLGAIPTILAYPNFKVEPNKYRFGLAGVSKNLGAKLIVLDAKFPEEFLGYVDTGAGAKVVRSAAEPSNVPPQLPPVDINPDTVAFIQHSAGRPACRKASRCRTPQCFDNSVICAARSTSRRTTRSTPGFRCITTWDSSRASCCRWCITCRS